MRRYFQEGVNYFRDEKHIFEHVCSGVSMPSITSVHVMYTVSTYFVAFGHGTILQTLQRREKQERFHLNISLNIRMPPTIAHLGAGVNQLVFLLFSPRDLKCVLVCFHGSLFFFVTEPLLFVHLAALFQAENLDRYGMESFSAHNSSWIHYK